jgi:hypothetical protein
VPIPEVQIGADDVLYHRLSILSHIRKDGTVSSIAYKIGKEKTFDPEPSVDLARLTTPQESVARAGRPGFALGELQVGTIAKLAFSVRHKPLDDNPSHCLIDGNTSMDTCNLLTENTRVIPEIVS